VELSAIADFLFEVGMLKRTPRSGFQFLGTGRETVAEHSLRCAVIGYVLGRMSGNLETNRIVLMCLFHDLTEARTGDLNYVNKKYVKADEEAAVRDMTSALPFGDEILRLTEEFRNGTTPEADSAHDADQLEMILQLKELGDLGNRYSQDWISTAVKRLRTEDARRLARSILNTDFSGWWYKEKDDEWWVNGQLPEPSEK
jgi:putative hydrolase of HD superfamily